MSSRLFIEVWPLHGVLPTRWWPMVALQRREGTRRDRHVLCEHAQGRLRTFLSPTSTTTSFRHHQRTLNWLEQFCLVILIHFGQHWSEQHLLEIFFTALKEATLVAMEIFQVLFWKNVLKSVPKILSKNVFSFSPAVSRPPPVKIFSSGVCLSVL